MSTSTSFGQSSLYQWTPASVSICNGIPVQEKHSLLLQPSKIVTLHKFLIILLMTTRILLSKRFVSRVIKIFHITRLPFMSYNWESTENLLLNYVFVPFIANTSHNQHYTFFLHYQSFQIKNILFIVLFFRSLLSRKSG